MSTRTAPPPTTDWSYPDWLGPGLAVLAVIAFAVALILTAGTSSDDAVEPGVAFDDMARSEVVERVERINGFTGAAAGTSTAASTATGAVNPHHEPTRDEVLERLYRINGVAPAEPDVPPNVR